MKITSRDQKLSVNIVSNNRPLILVDTKSSVDLNIRAAPRNVKSTHFNAIVLSNGAREAKICVTQLSSQNYATQCHSVGGALWRHH